MDGGGSEEKLTKRAEDALAIAISKTGCVDLGSTSLIFNGRKWSTHS